MSRFEGKTVVITGASRGIGAALAKRFAREGAAIVVSANEAACEKVAAEIAEAGGKAIAHVADVTKKSDVIALYDAADRAFGGVAAVKAGTIYEVDRNQFSRFRGLKTAEMIAREIFAKVYDAG